MRENIRAHRYRYLLVPFLFCLLISRNLPAQPADLLTYHTQKFGAIAPGDKYYWGYSGVAGYAAPDGREYAVLGGYDGAYIIDVTEQPLRLVTHIPGPESIWREVKTFGHHAYVVSEGGSGLQIIDLSGLPQAAVLVRADSSKFITAHTISQEGHYIYVHGSNLEAEANGGTLIFDLSTDPADPQLIGKFADHYVHDACIRNDTMYAAAIDDEKLSIVYLGPDRKNPAAVTSITYPGAGTHNAAVTVDGRYVMTTDEVGSTQKTLKIWDIRDVENISKAGDFTPEPGATIHNVYIKGNYAYVSWYTAGTRILDISDPANPIEVGFFDAYQGTDPYFRGNWDVYPYLPSGKILSSYTEGGLYVFTFDGSEGGRFQAGVRDAATGKPIEGAMIHLSGINRKLYTDAGGHAGFAGAREHLPYVAYAADYYLETGEVTPAAGGADLEILLRPIPRASHTLRVVDDATGAPVASFNYRVFGREKGEGTGAGGAQGLMLPVDSSYTVEAGIWGYLPAQVGIPAGGAATAEIRLKKGYADDAELPLGWAYSHPSDRAFLGQWERGVPVAAYGFIGEEQVEVQPGADHSADPGTHAFITGLSLPGEYSNQVSGGATSLISPQFDLTGYEDPYINCTVWFSNDSWYFPGSTFFVDDTLNLGINSGGGSWVTLAAIGESTDGWQTVRFRVRDVIQPGSAMRFRARVIDGRYASLLEAGLDDFSITEGNPSSAPLVATDGPAATARLLPNPIATSGMLEVLLPAAHRHVRGELFNMLGEPVALLHDGEMPAGRTMLPIDASGLPAGRYTWRLRLDGGEAVAGGGIVVR